MQQPPGQRGQEPGGRGAAGAQAARGRGGGGRTARPTVPAEFDATPIMALDDQDALIDMLTSSSSTFFQKAIACKRLSMIGTREAVPALAALLGEERLGHYARFGLEPMPDPSVDIAFRDALTKLKGLVLIGVITSIGVRRDVEAVEALGELMYDSDVEVARAAAASLGAISGPASAEVLMDGASRVSAEVRPVWARAALVCADRLLESDRRTATDMYSALTGDNMPKPVTLAARRRLMAAGI